MMCFITNLLKNKKLGNNIVVKVVFLHNDTQTPVGSKYSRIYVKDEPLILIWSMYTKTYYLYKIPLHTA